MSLRGFVAGFFAGLGRETTGVNAWNASNGFSKRACEVAATMKESGYTNLAREAEIIAPILRRRRN